MKIIMLLSNLDSLKGGGVTEVVYYLSKFFKNKKDINCKICSLKTEELSNNVKKRWESYNINVFKKTYNNSYAYSKDLKTFLKKENYDLIHTHGIWQYLSYLVLSMNNKKNTPYIVSPHGMLDEWALNNSKWKKKLLYTLYEKRFLEKASCIHALNREEAESIKKLGLNTPICIIPNGIEIPSEVDSLEPIWDTKIVKNKKVLLFLGRIHPKKGIDNLIDAWEKLVIDNLNEEWILVISGWSKDNYDKQIKEKVKNKNLQNDILFTGAVIDNQKVSVLQNADAFILPSFSEGLPMSILEAMSYKLPVLMTKECNLNSAFDSNSAIQIEPNVDSIYNKIKELNSLSDYSRNELAKKGFDFVKNDYTWDKITKDFIDVYSWILDKQNKPSTII